MIDAARELFEERGFERATVRAIGERAKVDPAMIARYFGNKEGLYIATLAEDSDEGPVDFAGLDTDTIVKELFDRWEARGKIPVARAMASASLDVEVLDQVRSVMSRRVTEPLADDLVRTGSKKADLESEFMIAAVLGVFLTRVNSTLPVLAGASAEEIREMLGRMAAGIVG